MKITKKRFHKKINKKEGTRKRLRKGNSKKIWWFNRKTKP